MRAKNHTQFTGVVGWNSADKNTHRLIHNGIYITGIYTTGIYAAERL